MNYSLKATEMQHMCRLNTFAKPKITKLQLHIPHMLKHACHFCGCKTAHGVNKARKERPYLNVLLTKALECLAGIFVKQVHGGSCIIDGFVCELWVETHVEFHSRSRR